jgi:hypothetical protein
MVNNLYFPLSLLRISRQLIMVLRIRMDIILCLEIQYHREMLSVISPLICYLRWTKKYYHYQREQALKKWIPGV